MTNFGNRYLIFFIIGTSCRCWNMFHWSECIDFSQPNEELLSENRLLAIRYCSNYKCMSATKGTTFASAPRRETSSITTEGNGKACTLVKRKAGNLQSSLHATQVHHHWTMAGRVRWVQSQRVFVQHRPKHSKIVRLWCGFKYTQRYASCPGTLSADFIYTELGKMIVRYAFSAKQLTIRAIGFW